MLPRCARTQSPHIRTLICKCSLSVTAAAAAAAGALAHAKLLRLCALVKAHFKWLLLLNNPIATIQFNFTFKFTISPSWNSISDVIIEILPHTTRVDTNIYTVLVTGARTTQMQRQHAHAQRLHCTHGVWCQQQSKQHLHKAT